jgi:polyphosphate kinase
VDERIGEDVSELFNALSGFSRAVSYRKLSVAPRSLRSTLVAKIREQAERARRGEAARLFAKLNALVDREIIQELYRASRAGLRIDLLVRGVCCLRPGYPGVSENIRVFSLIGRFLEHERVYVFGPESEEEVFLSSADWMPRNLDRRVEVLFPVLDPQLRERIRREVREPLELDNSRVYEMRPDGQYQRRQPEDEASIRNGQLIAQERVGEGPNRRSANGESRAPRAPEGLAPSLQVAQP